MPNTTPEFLKHHQIVRAGAGAGKTYTLTHKVVEIAEKVFASEKRWPRIVVTTFTRKATQELRERLMLLALDEKPHLIDFINSRSHLMVSTIHGVMDLFLKRYGSHLELDPGSTVVTEAQAAKLSKQVLRKTLLEGEAADVSLLEKIPFNRLADLMRRLDRLYAENPDAKAYNENDFKELFSKRSLDVARELESSALNIKEEATKPDWLQMADDYLALAALLKKPDWSKVRADFETRCASVKSARFSGDPKPVSEMTNDDAKLALKKAKEFLEPVYEPAVWSAFAAQFSELERVAKGFSKEFRAAKRQAGFLEINDLELLAMEAFRVHPHLASAFSREWDHWLIDEYQDTSPFQVRLLRELTGDEPCFVVGDPQQSIYLFRGARSEVFGQREAEILNAGGERKLLTVNRRSSPELLLFLNDFFKRFDPPFSEMDPFLKEGQAVDPKKQVAEIFIARDNDDGENGDRGGTVETDTPPDGETSKDETEMKAIVSRVQTLLEGGAKPEDICVLARTKKTLNEVAEWLTRFGIPTHVHAAAGFFERRETQDALAFLKFLMNPLDTFNTIEVLRSPCFRISDQLMIEVTQETAAETPRNERVPLWQELAGPGAEIFIKEESDRQTIHKLKVHLGNVAHMGLTGAFRQGLIESGFVDVSHIHDSSGRRESNIWKLLARLEAEEGHAGFNPLAFIAGTAAELKIDEGGGEGDAVASVEPNRVNLMTIHASKGLEFHHVILPRMDQKPKLTDFTNFFYDPRTRKWAARVPYGENGDFTTSLPEEFYVEDFKRQELEEHARVLYVALTRAIDTVFLSWTGSPAKNSWASMLKLNLEPGVHSESSYTYVVRDQPAEPQPRQNGNENSKIAIRPKWREKTEPSVPASLSVTEILDRQAGAHTFGTTDRDVIQRMKVAATGTAVHKLMELLKYPSQEKISALIERWFPRQQTKVARAIEFVRSSKTPPLSAIIESGEVEWGFAMIERGLLIEGAVDLWGRGPDGTVWIIDYKTGNSAHRQKAFEQMKLYSLAVRKSGLLKPDERLKLAAVYPFSEEIFVEDAPGIDEIQTRFGV